MGGDLRGEKAVLTEWSLITGPEHDRLQDHKKSSMSIKALTCELCVLTDVHIHLEYTNVAQC